jgi:hypothetical protein
MVLNLAEASFLFKYHVMKPFEKQNFSHSYPRLYMQMIYSLAPDSFKTCTHWKGGLVDTNTVLMWWQN